MSFGDMIFKVGDIVIIDMLVNLELWIVGVIFDVIDVEIGIVIGMGVVGGDG